MVGEHLGRNVVVSRKQNDFTEHKLFQTNLISSFDKVTMCVNQVYALNIAGLAFSLGLTVPLMVSLWLRWWNVGWMRVVVLCICSWLTSWIQSVDYWMDVTAHVLNSVGAVERSHTLAWAWLRLSVWYSGWESPGMGRRSSNKPWAYCPERLGDTERITWI